MLWTQPGQHGPSSALQKLTSSRTTNTKQTRNQWQRGHLHSPASETSAAGPGWLQWPHTSPQVRGPLSRALREVGSKPPKGKESVLHPNHKSSQFPLCPDAATLLPTTPVNQGVRWTHLLHIQVRPPCGAAHGLSPQAWMTTEAVPHLPMSFLLRTHVYSLRSHSHLYKRRFEPYPGLLYIAPCFPLLSGGKCGPPITRPCGHRPALLSSLIIPTPRSQRLASLLPASPPNLAPFCPSPSPPAYPPSHPADLQLAAAALPPHTLQTYSVHLLQPALPEAKAPPLHSASVLPLGSCHQLPPAPRRQGPHRVNSHLSGTLKTTWEDAPQMGALPSHAPK